MAGTSESVGAGVGVGVMVGDMSPNAFSTLEHRWRVKGGKPIASLRTLRVSHTMGLPSCFLPVPNSYSLLKPTEIDVGGLHPSLEGRGQVAATLSAEELRKNEIS